MIPEPCSTHQYARYARYARWSTFSDRFHTVSFTMHLHDQYSTLSLKWIYRWILTSIAIHKKVYVYVYASTRQKPFQQLKKDIVVWCLSSGKVHHTCTCTVLNTINCNQISHNEVYISLDDINFGDIFDDIFSIDNELEIKYRSYSLDLSVHC